MSVRNAQRVPPRDADLQILVRNARSGCASSHRILLRRYEGFIRWAVGRSFLKGADLDDILQEARIAWVEAVNDYDPFRHPNFLTFAEMVIRRSIYNAMQSSLAKKHTPLHGYESFSEPAGKGDPPETMRGQVNPSSLTVGDTLPTSEPSPSEQYAAAESEQLLREFLDASLTPIEHGALTGFLDGETYEDIARRLGVTPKAVDNALQRSRAKLNAYLELRNIDQGRAA